MSVSKNTADAQVFAQKATLHDLPSIQSAIHTLLSYLPEIQQLTPESRVLIKPNLLAKHSPDKAVTTDPDVVLALIVYLQQKGIKNITIADSPGGNYSTNGMKSAYKIAGLEQVAQKTGVTLYTECKSQTQTGPGVTVHQFNFLQPVFNCDLIINVPKLKTHVMTAMSGSVKNLFGLVPGLQKAEFHARFPKRPDFGNMLVDLYQTVPVPSVHIVDGLLAMQGDGPAGGSPIQCNLLLAATDPFLLDLAICHYIQLEPMKVAYLKPAHERGLCADTFNMEQLIGTPEAKQSFPSFELPKNDSKEPTSDFPVFLQGFANKVMKWAAPRPVIQKNTCIGCGKCAEICPQQVIQIKNKKAHIQYKNCIRCFCCHEICPVKAIDVKSRALFKL